MLKSMTNVLFKYMASPNPYKNSHMYWFIPLQ